jgi:AraC-like DNA-binding protein
MRAVFEKIEAGVENSFAVQQIDQGTFDAPWHFHPECELTYIREGSGERFVGDSMEPFSGGDLVLLGSGLPHFWRSRRGVAEGRSRAVVVHFTETFLGGETAGAREFSGMRKMLQQARQGWCFSDDGKLSHRIGNRLEKLVAVAGLKRLLLLLEILSELVDASQSVRSLSSAGHIPLCDLKASPRINRAYEYVYAHLGEGITLDAVSRVAGMSPAAFSRYFKRLTGRNLTHFIGELRISQACKLLRETDLGIAEVAYEVGFGSLSNFNRLFKELKGVSPRRWKSEE